MDLLPRQADNLYPTHWLMDTPVGVAPTCDGLQPSASLLGHGVKLG